MTMADWPPVWVAGAAVVDGFETAIQEMARVVRPGGAILVANMNGFSTAGQWIKDPDGQMRFVMDNYLDARPEWVSWRGIRVRNWHRPLSAYMQAFLGAGLRLTHFDEPGPEGVEGERVDRHRRSPHSHVMEWQKV